MKKKFIEVYDDLYSDDYTNYLEDIILKRPIVPFYHVPNVTDSRLDISDPSPGFSIRFHTNRPIQLPHQDTVFKYEFFKILYSLSDKLNFNISQILNGRSFIHLPSPNPGLDSIHVDLDIDHLVCLYYVNNSDGDTVLFEEDKKTEIKRVTPKKGRVVFFDGSIPHCSSRPSLNTRAVINMDFTSTFFG